MSRRHDLRETQDAAASGPMRRDPFRGDLRRRALRDPQRARETLEPYAKLHLDVVAARCLLACDADGRVDPFAEVWVDDELVGVSDRRMFSVAPTWDYTILLDVWSPLTIVRIRIMDHDQFSQNDVVGFVEFCVADLEPNSEVSGWFELRKRRYLRGTGPARLRRHRRRRDEHAARSPAPTPTAAPPALPERRSSSVELLLGASPFALCGAPADCAAWAETAGAPSETVGPPSEVTPRSSEDEVEEDRRSFEAFCDMVANRGARRPNAGEVRLRLRLDAAAEQDGEWYAFCFPRPHAEAFPSRTLSLEELCSDLAEIRRMGAHCLGTAACLPRYFATWQSPGLSCLALAWWSCLCVWPLWLMPTSLLWVVLLLALLRERRWQERMLVHESTAPLNALGFHAMAALGSTARLAAWLRRLVVSMGRCVASERELLDFAAGLLCGDAASMRFKTLVRQVAAKPWALCATRPRSCPKGHVVGYLGAPLPDQYRPCGNPGGCRAAARRPWRDAALFHCADCGVHICEPCIAAVARPPLWKTMPAEVLPEFLESALLHLEEPLDHLREVLDCALLAAAVPFEATAAGAAAARAIYGGCVAAMAAWYAIIWAFAHMPPAALSGGMVAAGWSALPCSVAVARGLVTRLRASADCTKHRRRREEAPLSVRWAFFTPD